jgi:hypothetical protein
MILERRTRKRPRNHTQTTSLFRTTHPLALKKDFTLIGETWIGVQGRKYRPPHTTGQKKVPDPGRKETSRKS